MFINKRSQERAAMQPASSMQSSGGNKRGMFSVIGPDIVITGNIKASSELHIEGRIEGDVDCATLMQGAESQIIGSVTAESARLAGAIEGAVRVKQLTVERAARITGDVEYENITIENGGHIDGRLKHMSAVSAVAVSAPDTTASADYDPTPVAPATEIASPRFGKGGGAA